MSDQPWVCDAAFLHRLKDQYLARRVAVGGSVKVSRFELVEMGKRDAIKRHLTAKQTYASIYEMLDHIDRDADMGVIEGDPRD